MTYTPRVYINGFPKAGLHMLEQAISPVVKPLAKNNWFGTTAFEAQIKNKDKYEEMTKALVPGRYVKGHSAYLPEFEQLLYGYGIVTIFIYRDLRDVVVSTANHMMKAGDSGALKAPMAYKYQALPTYEDVLIAVIEGIDGEPGIFERWELYAGWMNARRVCKVRFEDLRYKSFRTCERILNTLIGAVETEYNTAIDRSDNKVIVRAMSARMKQRKASKTFNKGTKAQWVKDFTPRVKEAFKACDFGWLQALGYANNDRW